MPRISSFYGIAIYMYWDERHHGRPHFHARYAGQAASIAFDGKVIAGSLPRRALVLVREWAALRGEQLAANWERARRAEPLELVDPLA
jgi:hypothetical protein